MFNLKIDNKDLVFFSFAFNNWSYHQTDSLAKEQILYDFDCPPGKDITDRS